MIDKYGRELTYLRVSLIDRCNLRCFYCMPHGALNPFKEDEILNEDEIVTIVSIFAELGIWKVRLTGGEPLLRKDAVNLVSRVKKIAGIREVVMTTNGVLLKHFASDLKKAGLDRINISLDTLDRENFKRITGADKWQDVLDGIQEAVDQKITPIKINAVLMKGVNDHEIMDLVDFSVKKRLDLRFIEWMPTANEILEVRAGRFMSADIAKKLIEGKYNLIPDDENPHAPARTFHLEGTQTKAGFISPLSNVFCAKCNRLRLKANGMMKTCLHGKEDLNLKKLLRQGDSRNEIKKHILETVFNRPEEHFLNSPEVPHNDFVMTAVGG